jgi:hypothetical protein
MAEVAILRIVATCLVSTSLMPRMSKTFLYFSEDARCTSTATRRSNGKPTNSTNLSWERQDHPTALCYGFDGELRDLAGRAVSRTLAIAKDLF